MITLPADMQGDEVDDGVEESVQNAIDDAEKKLGRELTDAEIQKIRATYSPVKAVTPKDEGEKPLLAE